MISPALTLLLGPRTRLGLALNTLVREHRDALETLGLLAYPSRVGDKLLRDLGEGLEPSEARETLGIGGEHPVILTATKGLAAPAGLIRSRELLPDAEVYLRDWARLAEGIETRIVMTIDPLPDVLLAADHAAANAAARATPWDALYEMSWADLMAEVREALPKSAVLALTTRGAFLSAETVAPLIFGAGAEVVLPETLRASLVPSDTPLPKSTAHLSGYFDTYRPCPDPRWLREVLGMDGVTADLLQSRFHEDVEAIRAMPDVQVI